MLYCITARFEHRNRQKGTLAVSSLGPCALCSGQSTDVHLHNNQNHPQQAIRRPVWHLRSPAVKVALRGPQRRWQTQSQKSKSPYRDNALLIGRRIRTDDVDVNVNARPCGILDVLAELQPHQPLLLLQIPPPQRSWRAPGAAIRRGAEVGIRQGKA